MLTTLIAAATLAAGLVLLFGFAWTVRQNVRRGELVRAGLAKRMAGLPLSRLLPRYGYLPRDFLHGTSINRVEAMLRMCEQCQALEQCQAALERGDAAEAFTFCPNRGALRPRG
ncbi:MAG TPA: hypothetical protein VKA50_03950 [Gammaproteobacteria bacterium]|nr:hypothetical protein [Gammaproteobacteria bacterium]